VKKKNTKTFLKLSPLPLGPQPPQVSSTATPSQDSNHRQRSFWSLLQLPE